MLRGWPEACDNFTSVRYGDNTAIVKEKLQAKRNKEERGVSMVEYALLIGLISMSVLASVYLLSSSISETFSEVAEPLN